MTAVRRRVTDPLLPPLLMAVGAAVAAWYAPILTWAIVGGLAGFALSGSV